MDDKIKELARLFLKLGVIGFGGPAAHIAMMKNEVVDKSNWMTEQEFLDLVGATNLIPGPNSTELAIHIGKERAGWKGLFVAGLCFILPAVAITLVFAWLYKKYGLLPEVQPFIYGVKPAIIAIIIGAVYPLAIKSLKSVALAILGLLALVLAFLKVNEIFILFGCGFAALLYTQLKISKLDGTLKTFAPFLFLQVPIKTALTITNFNLFLIFLKIGAILYGSGYVLFAFLDTELVQTGIIPRQTLIDAIAVGQFTPGPVFSSVSFIGYQIDSWKGAAIATIGIFLPSFIFVALLNPLVRRMRHSRPFSAFIDAVNVASVALIAAICFQMGRESIFDWRTALIAVSALTLVWYNKKINSAIVVIGGAIAGFLLTYI